MTPTRLLALVAGLTAGLVAPLSAAPAPQPAPVLPVETLFQTPALTSLAFSPNGKYVLCLVPYERRANLAVIDVEKGTKNLITNFKDKQAQQPIWANDNRILFRVDDDGKESFALYAVNRDGSDPVILASGYSTVATNDEVNARFTGLLRRLKKDPKNLLVTARLTHIDWNDVAKLDLKSGRMTTVVKAPGEVDRYVLDYNDEVRFAIVYDRKIKRVLYRDPNGRDWKEVGSHDVDEPGWEPLVFDGDNKTVYVWSDIGRKTRALYRYNTETKQLGDLVLADDTYDVISSLDEGFQPIFDSAKEKIVGFGYKADRTRFKWIDAEMEKIHRQMETSLPDTVHAVRQISEDGSRIIFSSYSDRDPGVYYLYNKPTNKVSEIAVVAPKVDPEQMASVKPVTITARDGMKLHGYLTLPKGREPKNLPMIMHPHGGPYGPRDDWVYNPEVQFYANRGFAVLQLDYRGSGGYGREYEMAGFKKWGLEMQNDLTDGVKWVVDQGIADPARVVISGASYGGYAVMAGLVYTPELYCAGVNYVGAVDIELLIPKAAPNDRMWWRHTRLGDLSKREDKERIYNTSPVNFASRVRVPVLMAYGKNDPRVVIEHGYDMESALRKAGKTYKMIVEKDEGHGFRKEELRIAFYREVDEFLDKVVPGRGKVEIGPTKVIDMPAKAKTE
jgi:dipeptidyl aminopeptidase/acylaminoacyl peptidase